MTPDWLVPLGTFDVHESQVARWETGELQRLWATQFPELFDSKDQELARSQGPSGYHFAEWLGAILVLHLTGYRSLIAKYEYPSHPTKQNLTRELLPGAVLSVVLRHKEFGETQCPDLLAYSPDCSDWFFCEVKGNRDRFSEGQRGLFEKLARVSGKPIRLVRFRWGGHQPSRIR